MPEIPANQGQSGIPGQVILGSLQRILKSETFSHSTTLRKALEYVVKTNIASPDEPIKEYSVATGAFGRGSDFDPKTDNIVRVQMHRLRDKLEDFYRREGKEEQIRITIPRGRYEPEYIRNLPNIELSTESLPQASHVPSKSRSRYVKALWIAVAALAISNVFFAASLFRNKGPKHADALAQPLSSLWQPFLSMGSQPLIVFANPAFLVGKRGNLYRYKSPEILSMAMGTRVLTSNNEDLLLAGSDETGPLYYFDSYTGTGELVAATDVARFLTLHGQNYMIERSLLASDEDIMRNNVIFLGGDKEDRLLGRLPLQEELLFEPPPSNQYAVGSYIKDISSPDGHPSTYHLQLDPTTGAIQGDYALISLLPNVSAGHYVLDLGGLTTLGTEAAARFVTSSHDMTLLEQMLASSEYQKARVPLFQALLHVSVRDGVPLETRCILVRELK